MSVRTQSQTSLPAVPPPTRFLRTPSPAADRNRTPTKDGPRPLRPASPSLSVHTTPVRNRQSELPIESFDQGTPMSIARSKQTSIRPGSSSAASVSATQNGRASSRAESAGFGAISATAASATVATISPPQSPVHHRSPSPFETISDLSRVQNTRVGDILQSVQRLDHLRERSRQRNLIPRRLNQDMAIQQDDLQHQFDDTLRQLNTMLESHTQTPKKPPPAQSTNPNPTASSNPASSGHQRNAEAHEAGNSAMDAAVAEQTHNQQFITKFNPEKDRNPTIRFLRSFLHAPYDRRAEILNHREWAAFSSSMMERCAATMEQAKTMRKSQDTTSKKNMDSIYDRKPENYHKIILDRASKHKQKEAQALERKKQLDKEAAEKKLHALEQRELHRKTMSEQRKRNEDDFVKTRQIMRRAQRLWMFAIHAAYVQSKMSAGLNAHRNRMYLLSLAQNQAESAKLIQAFYRLYTVHAKRKSLNHADSRYLLPLLTIRKWKFHTSIQKILKKKTRAVNILKQFLKDCASLAKTSTLIKNFRYSVIRIQRWWRSVLEMHRARVYLLSLQWKKYEDERRKEAMSRKNLTQLTPAQRKRILEIQAAGLDVPFEELVRENISRAKKSYVRIPTELRYSFIDAHLRLKLSEYRAEIIPLIRAVTRVRESKTMLLLQTAQFSSDPSMTFGTAPRKRPKIVVDLPYFFILLSKEELQDLIDKAIEYMNKNESTLQLPKLTHSLSASHSQTSLSRTPSLSSLKQPSKK